MLYGDVPADRAKEFREIREFSEGLRAFGWGLKEFREIREFSEGLRAFGRHSAP